MPKDFLQGASLTPTFIQHFTVIIILPFLMLKNAFKKHPPQNRTNVQIKGGGGERPFEQCSKKLHFFERMASLSSILKSQDANVFDDTTGPVTPLRLGSECKTFFAFFLVKTPMQH